MELAIELDGLDIPVVRTRMQVEHASRGSERRSSCLESSADIGPSASVVRVGVDGESVTLRDASATYVLGCDNGAGEREGGRRWCGGAYGRLHGGQLLDPRLNLLCRDGAGNPLAFAWIVPSTSARFVVVRRDGFAEAYQTTGSLPVRVVSTEGIDLATSSATFDVSEHDRRGVLLARYSVDARVAG